MRRGDFFQGILWLCIGIAVVILSSRYGMGTFSEPGPGALPFGLGLVFILLSTILIFRSWQLKEAGQGQRSRFGSRWRKVSFIILFLALITFLMEGLGYLLSVLLLISFPMVIMEPKRWSSALLLGLIASFSSYVLFGLWFKVPLPRGLFYF